MSLFNPNRKFTQSDVAVLLGLKSDRQVRNLIQKGILPAAKGRDGMDPLACIHGYITYKSQLQNSNTEAEIEDEKEGEPEKRREQMLKNDEREERIKLSRIKRKVLEKRYTEISIIEDVISQVATSLRTRVDSWLPKIKMECPDIPYEGLEVLRRELAMVLNELSEVQPDLSEYEDSDIQSGFAGLDTIEDESADDRGGVGG